MKTCSQCGVSKLESEYRKRMGPIGGPDDLRANCKACCSITSRRWRESNPEKKKETDRLNHLYNKEERNKKTREYYVANKERMNAINKKWGEDHKEEKAAYNALRRVKNGEVIRARRREHYQRNKARYIAQARTREISQMNATPPWADLKAIEAIYESCAVISKSTGTIYHVDHIHPLRGKNFCGLHVSWNLQVIPGEENTKKSNKLIVIEEVCHG